MSVAYSRDARFAMIASEEVRFICDKTLSEGEVIVVKERGVKTLQACSVKRQNKNHQRFLAKLTTMTVHTACKKHYINEKLILAAIRRGGAVQQPLPSKPPVTRSASLFDFKKHCFLCSEEVSEEFRKYKKKYRKVVFEVKKNSVKDIVLTAIRNCNNEWGRTILQRIEYIPDLVAVNAKYHNGCMKQLYSSQVAQKRPRGQRAVNIEEAMELIYSYLNENSHECQFSLNELLNQIQTDCRPDFRTVKLHLSQKYGEDILFVDAIGQPTVVCFRNTGYKILTNTWYEEKKANKDEERLRVVRAAAAIILEDIRSQVYNTAEYPPSDDFMKGVMLWFQSRSEFFFLM